MHLIKKGDKDVWSGEVDMQEGEAFFGISRIFMVTLSVGMEMKYFPFDQQNLNIFFEANLPMTEIVFQPSIVRKRCLELELGTMATSPDFHINDPIIEFNSFGDDYGLVNIIAWHVSLEYKCIYVQYILRQ